MALPTELSGPVAAETILNIEIGVLTSMPLLREAGRSQEASVTIDMALRC
jgi:hypothetical protein